MYNVSVWVWLYMCVCVLAWHINVSVWAWLHIINASVCGRGYMCGRGQRDSAANGLTLHGCPLIVLVQFHLIELGFLTKLHQSTEWETHTSRHDVNTGTQRVEALWSPRHQTCDPLPPPPRIPTQPQGRRCVLHGLMSTGLDVLYCGLDSESMLALMLESKGLSALAHQSGSNWFH